MKKTIAFVFLLMLLAPVSASALEAEDLVAIAAMPLAVAAVADIADVPTSELLNLVATLNQAQVPAPQFIEVVRYAPVALVDTSEPFVPYVETQVQQGVRGEALALAIEDRIETYDGADTIDVVRAPRVVAVDDDFYPEVVVTRFQPVRFDPLALVAMPLAVAAVSEITDVPAGELVSFISLLNQARVPPAQFVEVVRYSPVALVDTEPQFLTYVTTQLSDGRRGIVLARSIAERYELLGVDGIDIDSPPVMELASSEVFVPAVVTTRVAEARSHPHGGPPGQLKKELGLQTGAEVVHGKRPGRADKARVAEQRGSRNRGERVAKAPKRERVRATARGNGGGNEAKRAARVERAKPKRAERAVGHVNQNRGPSQSGSVAKPDRGQGGQRSGGGKGNSAQGNSGKSNSGKGNGKGKG